MTMDAMIEIRDLSVTFNRGRKPVKAVNGVSLSVKPGEVVALLGRSGSGKSVTMRSLLEASSDWYQDRRFDGGCGPRRDGAFRQGSFRPARRCHFHGISRNPGWRSILSTRSAIRSRKPSCGTRRSPDRKPRHAPLALFQKVRIPSPERRLQNYPHEMSGGMLQRSMIAMALACNPKVLLADEPTTALDATVQIQILLLIRELQEEYGLSVIFVTHDIGVAAEVADRIAVMYAGRIVEEGKVADIIRDPKHPYTKGLLGARVELAHGRDRLITIPGAPPDLAAMPPGCAFAPRCGQALDICRKEVTGLMPAGEAASVACVQYA